MAANTLSTLRSWCNCSKNNWTEISTTTAHHLGIVEGMGRRSRTLVLRMGILLLERERPLYCGRRSRTKQYQVLRRAQGSTVPVFLGAISLAKIYFLHGAGEIRHMLLMARGGESTTKCKQRPVLRHEIYRSMEEIRSLGVIHRDLRPDNILWSAELERAIIIDFHRAELDRRLMRNRMKSVKRPLCRTEEQEPKQLCVL